MSDFTPVKSKSTMKKEKKVNVAVSATANVPEGNAVLCELTPYQRFYLLAGPTIDVRVGNLTIRGDVPQRMLMATSTLANAYFRANPMSKVWTLPAFTVKPNAIKIVLKGTTSPQFVGATLRQVPIGCGFVDHVDVYAAGLFLGMEEHVQHIKTRLNWDITTYNFDIPCDVLVAIASSLPPSNAVYQHAARRLAFFKFRNVFPAGKELNTMCDPEYLDEFFIEYPEFANVVQGHFDEHVAEVAGKMAFRAAFHPRQDSLTHEAIQQADNERVKLNALRGKLREGGILVLSAEEVELRAKHGL
ncbi:hypothetical protein P280DRAFT_484388 [Massarina eburnea CBS 473.64]|uniref:Uncharacterized protein n=1 Tax=Massarina eburnea CBS 473.64 TaxID=1395130 RepID=A0A6A6RK98_9PLEO|nr:hypothetical protein P280DRAFT_484388 [Massarina eburnea CBS 473.64]